MLCLIYQSTQIEQKTCKQIEFERINRINWKNE